MRASTLRQVPGFPSRAVNQGSERVEVKSHVLSRRVEFEVLRSIHRCRLDGE